MTFFATNLAYRSGFSLGASLLKPEQCSRIAADSKLAAVGLCDMMNVSGMVEFSREAVNLKMNGVVGAVIRIAADPLEKEARKGAAKTNPKYTVKVFAKSEKGLKSLFKLISIGYQADHFHYVPRVGLDEVLNTIEDCVVLSGDFEGLASQRNYKEIGHKLSDKFGEDFFLELTAIDTPYYDKMNGRILELHSLIPCAPRLTVSRPVLYEKPEQFETLTILKGVTSNTGVDSIFLERHHTKDFVQHEPETYTKQVIAMLKGAFSRSELCWDLKDTFIKLLKSDRYLACIFKYKFEKMPVSLPQMGVDGKDEFRKVVEACKVGWSKRLLNPTLGYTPKPEAFEEYKTRLNYELSILYKMGFSSYFLLTQEIVQWARDNGVRTGPGRGSVGGSLVAFLMGITDVDPIRFGLLFERFINPERIDLPDADLDFMSSRRHMVVERLTEKYGSNRVAGISNYSTLASASALRDTGRIYGLDGIALSPTKLVPKIHGQPLSLTESAEQVPELEKFKNTYTDVWNHALSLEGAMRSFGQHAAGIVVAGEDLINRGVVETRSGSQVMNWDKRIVEDLGLVKMDVLGLSTLDVLEIAKEMIKERHGINLEYLNTPLDDEKVLEAFGRGETQGVFQFESSGMRRLLKDLRKGGILTFDDIAAATALYRPGPMDSGMMDDYVQTRQGKRTIEYEHPIMGEALSSTYGVAVYQEQVMKLATDLANFTLPEADALRKAMGKKDKEKMAAMRDKWVKGCHDKVGMNERVASYIFDKIEKFAAYGFNRSHSVAYSIVSWWTMYLKVYYPAEYFAACMSIVAEDKIQGLVADALESGIKILPPHINVSTSRYSILNDREIVAPFNVVKGISENTANRIVELRESTETDKFETPEHFEELCSAKGSKVNARVRESLNKVGALACFGGLPANHPDRAKDQMELMGSIMLSVVKSDRVTDTSDKFLKAKIIHVVKAYNDCKDCDLQCNGHPTVRLGKTVKYMVITDCPTWQEEKANRMFEGDSAKIVRHSIEANSLGVSEGYFTSVVKAKKSDKFLSNEQINNCKRFLDEEIRIIKPGCIVALGNAAIKYFLPDFKGNAAEASGKSIYLPDYEATLVIGVNPLQAIFDSSKIDSLTKTFATVSEVVN